MEAIQVIPNCTVTTTEATDHSMQTPVAQLSAAKDVLLVEDSLGDVRLMQEAFRTANADVRLHIAGDGVQAMDFLRRLGVHTSAPRPDLILLDLNLPRMDGHEVLALIKEDSDLKAIPTVILTTSDSQTDIARGYHLKANCYLGKPSQFDDFEKLVVGINRFWLATATPSPAD
jgi:chemotaxis family two-component system response regulator Rcp1